MTGARCSSSALAPLRLLARPLARPPHAPNSRHLGSCERQFPWERDKSVDKFRPTAPTVSPSARQRNQSGASLLLGPPPGQGEPNSGQSSHARPLNHGAGRAKSARFLSTPRQACARPTGGGRHVSATNHSTGAQLAPLRSASIAANLAQLGRPLLQVHLALGPLDELGTLAEILCWNCKVLALLLWPSIAC